MKDAFAECLTNAPDSPATQMESLQDISITTIERAEPKNPTMNTPIENPHFKSLLQDPELNAPLVDPDVKALLEDPDVNAYLQNPTVDPPSGVFPLPSGLFP